MKKFDMGNEQGYEDGYEIGHEHGYEDGYEHGRASMRMTAADRQLFYSALDALRDGGVTGDQIVLEVLDYAKKS